jgi:hypothetical protein
LVEGLTMLISLDTWRKQIKEIRATRSTEAVTLGKVVDECHRLIALKGLSGDFNDGYRHALRDVTAYILAELKDKP